MSITRTNCSGIPTPQMPPADSVQGAGSVWKRLSRDSEEPCLRGMAYRPFHRISESGSICSHGQAMDTCQSEISTTCVGVKAQLTRKMSPTLIVSSFVISLSLLATRELHGSARLACGLGAEDHRPHSVDSVIGGGGRGGGSG